MKKIDLFKVSMSPEAIPLVSETLLSGFIGQGERVEQFESMLQNWFGNTHLDTVNSATSGLHLALHICKDELGYSRRTEVLTTPKTCTATNMVILANGLDVKWVDVDPHTCNMDLDDLERKISPKTLAIMLVHWGGYSCDLDRVNKIADKCLKLYNFRPRIIEDAAHAWGAKYKNKLIGNHGNFTVFSFQAIKHLTTGDGGLIISPDDATHRKVKLLRWYGLDRTSSADFRCSQNIEKWGYKFHMNDINASIGIKNLPLSQQVINKHKENGVFLNEALKNVPGIKLLENNSDRESTYWVYTLNVEKKENFIKKMHESGITTSLVHDRNDKHECFSSSKCILPGMDKSSESSICIPCGWWVTPEDRQHIVDCIRGGW